MKGSKKQPQSDPSAAPAVDLAQLEQLLNFMTEHGLEEFEYAQGDLRIRLKKASTHGGFSQDQAFSAVPGPQVARTSQQNPLPAPHVPEPVPAAPVPPAEELHVVKSPIVGTFYSAPNPDAPSFVKIGDTVQAGQTICIVEAMKLMNEIEADVGGEVVRVLIENGQPVEYGEPLFELRAAKKKK